MALIDELKERRAEVVAELETQEAFVVAHQICVEDKRTEIADLDRAIAALTPAPDFEAEKEVAREQLEREPEIPEEGLGSSLIAMGYGDDDTPAEHISILTGDPAIEPESGLHEERPALNEAMQDERTCTCHPSDRPFECMKQYAASECIAAFEAKYPSALTTGLPHPEPVEGYAPVTNPEAHIQAVEAERFAQPTNPDADAIARAHDWYDPKAVHERNKFNPFSIFRAKEDA